MPVGGGNGGATDVNGKFTINVPDNVKTATVSAVGYKPKTVTLETGMTVYMATEASTLDDVVVVAYGTATKESLTGSVSVVDSKKIEDRPVTSATAALEGNAPGVQVNNTTGQPGDSPEIRIRGVGSITGTNNPAYVVDGVIFKGSISDINANDIESITVLKDAASCALYGVQGSNGVVLITTKKAKQRGKVEVSLQVREGVYNRGLAQYDRLGTDDWMETMYSAARTNLMQSNSSLYPDAASANAYLSGGGFINELLKGNNVYNKSAEELFDANGKLQGQVLPGYTDLDWWKAISRTGFRQEYNLNVAAASDNYNMFASVGYLNEKGYLLRSDFERYNARFNVNVQPLSYFKFGVNLAASTSNSDYNDKNGTSYVANPFATMYYAPIYPYYAHDENGNIIYEDGKPTWNMNGRNGDRRNLGYELRNNFNSMDKSVIDANAYATIIFPYNFELTFRGNMNRDFASYKDYQNAVLGDAAGIGRLTAEDDVVKYHTFNQMLTWNHKYGSDDQHSFDALIGHENTTQRISYDYVSVEDQISEGYYAIDNFQDINSMPQGAYYENRMESYLGRVRYNYLEKYFVEGSLRRDGSDRFAKDNRWGTFWSVGGGWVFSKENFAHNLTWLDYGKLRVSYGTVGNYLAAPRFSYSSLYGYTTMTNSAILIRTTSGNGNLKWEAQKTFDIALEGSLFHNRLNVSVGYFDKRTSNLIFSVNPPSSTGIQIWEASNSSMATPYNIGAMSNHGWEISFDGTIYKSKDFTLGGSLDMTFIKNTVKGLPYGGKDYANGLQRLSEGRSIYEWYLYTFAGVDQLTGKSMYVMDRDQLAYYYKDSYTSEEVDAMWEQRLASARSAGTLIERDGKYYTSDTSLATKTWHGTAMPTVYGSFGLNANYKNVRFGILFTYSLGGTVFDSSYQSLMSVSDYTGAIHSDNLKAWQEAPEGMTADDPNRIDPNGIPSLSATDTQDNNADSDRFLTSASWLVLKNVNLSYDLPQKWVSALKLQSLNIGVTAENLFTVAARKGLNPQRTWSGQQSSTGEFVTSRVITFQLTAKF